MWLSSGLQSFTLCFCLPVPGGLQCCLVSFLSLPPCSLPQVLVFAPSLPTPALFHVPAFLAMGVVTSSYVGRSGQCRRSRSQAHSLREGSGAQEEAMETEGGLAEPAGQEGSR